MEQKDIDRIIAKYTLSNKAVEYLSNIWNYTVDTWSEKTLC